MLKIREAHLRVHIYTISITYIHMIYIQFHVSVRQTWFKFHDDSDSFFAESKDIKNLYRYRKPTFVMLTYI